MFIFVRKKCKKRFWAKPGSEPVTTRVSTGGCLNHSATELVYNSLEFFRYSNLSQNLIEFECRLWPIEQIWTGSDSLGAFSEG